MVSVAAVILTIWFVPLWQGTRWQGHVPTAQLPGLVNEFRRTVAQIIGGAALLVGLYFTWRRIEISREEQITERFSRAIEHLGSDKSDIRLGGIYALERIAKDSEHDHWPVIEILCAFIRERLSREKQRRERKDEPAKPSPPDGPPPPPTDVQAALSVVARRARRPEPHRLELAYLDFTRMHVRDGHFDGAELMETLLVSATFEGCSFVRADLRESRADTASFRRCDLQGAILTKIRGPRLHFSDCDLRGASLIGSAIAGLSKCRLNGASLRSTQFEQFCYFAGCDVTDADFQDADLRRVNFEDAIGIQAAKLHGSVWDESTKWPQGFAPPPSAPRKPWMG